MGRQRPLAKSRQQRRTLASPHSLFAYISTNPMGNGALVSL